jgi:hypothetical protein
MVTGTASGAFFWVNRWVGDAAKLKLKGNCARLADIAASPAGNAPPGQANVLDVCPNGPRLTGLRNKCALGAYHGAVAAKCAFASAKIRHRILPVAGR